MGISFMKRRHGRIGNADKLPVGLKCYDTAAAILWTTPTFSSVHNKGFPLLQALALEGQWEDFIQLVYESSLEDWKRTDTQAQGMDHSVAVPKLSTTPLHVALDHRPPVTVVHVLIAILIQKFHILIPEEWQDDPRRQTPLHVAVASGCHPDVIQRLLAGESLAMPAILCDEQQRTALHVACGTPVVRRPKTSLFAPNQLALDKWNKRQVISILLQHYPQAAALKDEHDKTPLDYLRELQLSKATEVEVERTQGLHSSASSGCVIDSDSLIELAAKCRLENSNVPLIVPGPTGERLDQIDHSVSLITMDDDLLLEGDNRQEEMVEPRGLTTFGEIHESLNFLDVFGWSCNCFE